MVDNHLGETKQPHDTHTSNLDQEQVLSKGFDLPPFKSQLVIMDPSLIGWQEVRKKKMKKRKFKYYFITIK